MIQSKNRAFWMGASDMDFVMGNWTTATFKKWWLEKLGIHQNDIQTKAMMVGNAFEGKVLDTIPGIIKNTQIIIPELRLRVNLDGNTQDHIYEVKTTKNEYKLTKSHWRQTQAEMLAWKLKYGEYPELTLLSYQGTDQEYQNYFTPIDPGRLKQHPVSPDEAFAEECIKRLEKLTDALNRGVLPC